MKNQSDLDKELTKASYITTDSDIRLMFEIARNSYHVSENPLYNKAAQFTQVTYSDSAVINAFAHQQQYGMGYGISIFAGLCNAARVAATGIITKNPDKILNTFKAIGSFVQDNRSKFPEKKLFNLLDVLAVDIRDRKTAELTHRMTLAMVFSVIAHELGHICLGRCESAPIRDLVTIRNDERMADLFAASLAESVSAFKMDFVPATIFMEILLLWVSKGDTASRVDEDDEDEKKNIPRTHPASAERIQNFLNANEDSLAEYGITKNNIGFFLPQ